MNFHERAELAAKHARDKLLREAAGEMNGPHKFSDDEQRLNYGLSAIMEASNAYPLKRIDRQTQIAIVREIERHFGVSLLKEET